MKCYSLGWWSNVCPEIDAVNLVNKANSVHSLFLLYLFLVYFLCMFRASMCPSSGGTTVFMRHLVLVILCGWLSGRQGEVKFHFTSGDPASLYNLVNKANSVHNLFLLYLFSIFSLHVSGDYVPIIRRNICVYATLGTCYSLCMTVWKAG